MTHRQFTDDIDMFAAVLRDASQHRTLRAGLTQDRNGHTEIVWSLYERGRMYLAVNEIRAQRGLEPVTVGDIDRVEQVACGHCDYARKFALYCAEVANGISTVAP